MEKSPRWKHPQPEADSSHEGLLLGSAISSVNQKNEEGEEWSKIRAANSDSAVISRPTVTQYKLLAHQGTSSLQRWPILCKPCGAELSHIPCALWRKWLTLVIKMGLLHYSVPHIHLIVSIAIALTANKHNLIAHQLFDGRKQAIWKWF